jgi:hypothetical protein
LHGQETAQFGFSIPCLIALGAPQQSGSRAVLEAGDMVEAEAVKFRRHDIGTRVQHQKGDELDQVGSAS